MQVLKTQSKLLWISCLLDSIAKFVAQVFLFSLVTSESTPRSGWGKLGCGGGREGKEKERGAGAEEGFC
jgi:hypothetical protein